MEATEMLLLRRLLKMPPSWIVVVTVAETDHQQLRQSRGFKLTACASRSSQQWFKNKGRLQSDNVHLLVGTLFDYLDEYSIGCVIPFYTAVSLFLGQSIQDINTESNMFSRIPFALSGPPPFRRSTGARTPNTPIRSSDMNDNVESQDDEVVYDSQPQPSSFSMHVPTNVRGNLHPHFPARDVRVPGFEVQAPFVPTPAPPMESNVQYSQSSMQQSPPPFSSRITGVQPPFNQFCHSDVNVDAHLQDDEVVFDSQPRSSHWSTPIPPHVHPGLHHHFPSRDGGVPPSETQPPILPTPAPPIGPNVAPSPRSTQPTTSNTSSARQSSPLSDTPPDEDETRPTSPPRNGRGRGRGGRGRRGRPKKTKETNTSGRFHWDLRSTVKLLQSKKSYDEKRMAGDLCQKIKTIEEQWIDITAICVASGLAVDWKQAYEKFKRVSLCYREISDWERNIPSGKDSYWKMSVDERIAEDKFSHNNFDKDIYDLMEELFGARQDCESCSCSC